MSKQIKLIAAFIILSLSTIQALTQCSAPTVPNHISGNFYGYAIYDGTLLIRYGLTGDKAGQLQIGTKMAEYIMGKLVTATPQDTIYIYTATNPAQSSGTLTLSNQPNKNTTTNVTIYPAIGVGFVQQNQSYNQLSNTTFSNYNNIKNVSFLQDPSNASNCYFNLNLYTVNSSGYVTSSPNYPATAYWFLISQNTELDYLVGQVIQIVTHEEMNGQNGGSNTFITANTVNGKIYFMFTWVRPPSRFW